MALTGKEPVDGLMKENCAMVYRLKDEPFYGIIQYQANEIS